MKLIRLKVMMVISLSLLIFSCQKDNKLNTISKSPVSNSAITSPNSNGNSLPMVWQGPLDPPLGYHWEWGYEFDQFNFHRPKFGCARGFWFCTIHGGWYIRLVPDSPVTPMSYVSGDTAHLWGRVDTNGKFEVHFPIALASLSGYSSSDLDTLNVDDEMPLLDDKGNVTKVMVKGDYPTTKTSAEIIATVDIK